MKMSKTLRKQLDKKYKLSTLKRLGVGAYTTCYQLSADKVLKLTNEHNTFRNAVGLFEARLKKGKNLKHFANVYEVYCGVSVSGDGRPNTWGNVAGGSYPNLFVMICEKVSSIKKSDYECFERAQGSWYEWHPHMKLDKKKEERVAWFTAQIKALKAEAKRLGIKKVMEDFHRNNVGINSEGNLVLFDYSHCTVSTVSSKANIDVVIPVCSPNPARLRKAA